MKKLLKFLAISIACAATTGVLATVVVPVHLTDVNGVGAEIGTVKAENTSAGLLITPDLHHLPAGTHGFHVHAMAMCDHDGMAAGGHFDPAKTEKHLGPYADGHLGDLPVLVVNKDGTATLPVLAPRLKEADLAGHALMIHAGSDNYSDTPEKLGGGGARIACGVIQ